MVVLLVLHENSSQSAFFVEFAFATKSFERLVLLHAFQSLYTMQLA
jgi:hypothetical protein